MLAVFLLTGLWFTLRSGVFQLRGLPLWMRTTFGSLFREDGEKSKEERKSEDRRKSKKERKNEERKNEDRKKSGDEHSISQWQALTSALAACLGTGNIVGVATVITLGGPGAVFWMLLSAFLGMMTCCAENILGLRYRWRTESGGWMGGPMAYLSKGLKSKPLAGIYAALLTLASFGIGSMTQANAIAEAAKGTLRTPNIVTGLLICLLVGMVIFGGVKRIARVTEKIVPFMTGLFLTLSLVVLLANRERIPGVIAGIMREAFRVKAAAGGAAAYGIRGAMRYGVARGVFSNEAGLGSSAVIHAAADVERPAIQGMWGIAEVFIDTIVMCTVTALVLLCSGAWVPGGAYGGVALAGASFAGVFGAWGYRFMAFSITLFAFATLTGWSYYGEQGARYLLGEKSVTWYRVLYLGSALLGSVMRLDAVWSVADSLNGLMAIPNLIGLLWLSGEAVRELRSFERSLTSGGRTNA
ncbi:MAG: alanine:cation symporter family protein [Oscillospiraceae bacterium]|nr:alanine:cation symporter family protein [Oscillospiraceae bacterium]